MIKQKEDISEDGILKKRWKTEDSIKEEDSTKDGR